MFADNIQEAIVEERNNFGDNSVSGDDLALSAYMAVLQYAGASTYQREQMVKSAMCSQEVIEESMPEWLENIKESS